MILILVRFMQIRPACEIWQIYHKALVHFMDSNCYIWLTGDNFHRGFKFALSSYVMCAHIMKINLSAECLNWWQNAWTDVWMLKLMSEAPTNAGKDFKLNIEFVRCRWHTNDSVFWLAKMTLCIISSCYVHSHLLSEHQTSFQAMVDMLIVTMVLNLLNHVMWKI